MASGAWHAEPQDENPTKTDTYFVSNRLQNFTSECSDQDVSLYFVYRQWGEF